MICACRSGSSVSVVGGADRQPQAVADLRQHLRIGWPWTGFYDGDPAARISRKPFR
jgi:hypothetical protein